MVISDYHTASDLAAYWSHETAVDYGNGDMDQAIADSHNYQYYEDRRIELAQEIMEGGC